MKTAAVGSGKGAGCFHSSDAKPSPRKSIPPPATEEEEDMLEEILASPPCPPVPQVFGLDDLDSINNVSTIMLGMPNNRILLINWVPLRMSTTR